MSWQSYIDTNLVGTGSVTKAAIIGLHIKSVWAKSADLEFKPGELEAILTAFDKPNAVQESGLRINGIKYFFLLSDENSIQLKQKLDGACLVKTKQGIILGVYESPIQQTQCFAVVSGLGEYLIGQGY